MRFTPLAALVSIQIFGADGQGSTSVFSREEGMMVAENVRAIFEAKCVDCHGPKLVRPKGKFGYVLDLKRMAANPKFIVPGDPKDSVLYDLILHNEMPGEEADVAALTVEEKETVRRWIEIGAPAESSEAVESAPRPIAKTEMVELVAAVVVSTKCAEDPFWKQAIRWVGKFHPVSTHFPVALMLVAVVAEAIGWWTRRESWMQTVRFLVVLAALGGLAAAGLGWMNAYFSSYDKAPGALLWWHRWLGSATSGWALICAALACLGPCVEGTLERRRFRGALLLGAALVSVTGFLGSALIYGLDHYLWN